MSKFMEELQTKLCSEKVKELLDSITINSAIMNALDERDLLKQRINKALEYIDIQFDNNGTISKELKEILKGGSNENNL